MKYYPYKEHVITALLHPKKTLFSFTTFTFLHYIHGVTRLDPHLSDGILLVISNCSIRLEDDGPRDV